MKAIHLIILVSFGLSPSGLFAQAIGINTVLVSPTPPTACDVVNLDINGFNGCANFQHLGNSSLIQGNTIIVNVNFSAPTICLPAIVPFGTSYNLGLIPAGQYTLQVHYQLNGTPQSFLSSILIISCCDSITLDQPSITTGTYEALVKISALGTIPPNQSVTFNSGSEILLSPGFAVDSQSIFSALIGSCLVQSSNLKATHETEKFRKE